MKILNWLKSLKRNEQTYIKPQKFVNIKRDSSTVEFIHAGHPLYDAIVSKEENRLRLLAPNETAYNETSLTHNFVAIVTYNDNKYLVINSFKHFKEQSIGGLLQFDENIYNVIPFFEDEEEYQTASGNTFREVYEYDHPVQSYAFIKENQTSYVKLTLERGKRPITVKTIDENRSLFTDKLSQTEIEQLDYVVIPALNTYEAIRQKRTSKAS
ncbi:MAG: hypothetical protein J6C85_01015 [Alphaproteobacteria bacterium]|nr:hypothetical protein [Alphaproteobacteria bacterium]